MGKRNGCFLCEASYLLAVLAPGLVLVAATAKERRQKPKTVFVVLLKSTMKIVAAFIALLGAVNAIELTPDNWDSETAGKTVFIKFLAPW